MSEEKLDRIEAQIAELREMMLTNMQDMTVIKQDMTATKQNFNALSEDVISLRHRVDSMEGTVAMTIKEGFESMRNYLDDLNYDLANNERKTRRLSRRVARLEKDD